MIPLAVSSVLRDATQLKIDELSRAREEHRSRYETNPEILAAGHNTLGKLNALLKAFQGPYTDDDDLDDEVLNLKRCLEQAKDDRCISEAKLKDFEKRIQRGISMRRNRLEVSALHVDLLKEALHVELSADAVAARLDKADLEDDFDYVEREFEEIVDAFERMIFEPTGIDNDAFDAYLLSFFAESRAQHGLQRLRTQIEDYSNDFLTETDNIDDELVIWCIHDLLQNSLLSEDKKRTLQGYLQSPATIRELKSILNMRDVRHWDWRNKSSGLKVSPRKNADGHHVMAIEEDIVDMLFLHAVATGWSIQLRSSLQTLVTNSKVWPPNRHLTQAESEKREYYLGAPRHHPAPVPSTICGHCNSCLSPPPPPPPPKLDYLPPPPPPNAYFIPPPPPVTSKTAFRAKKKKPYTNSPYSISKTFVLNYERHRNYGKEFLFSRLPKIEGSAPAITPANETKANAMKYLATEARFHKEVNGEVDGISVVFDNFASALPHSAVIAVLKFIGVPRVWLDFFTRFLEAPLNVGSILRGVTDQVVNRTRGVPEGHGLETFFSEALFFFLDLAIHQGTGSYLFRLREKCYFVGPSESCIFVNREITKFASMINMDITSTLGIDPNSFGLLNFRIEPEQGLNVTINTEKVTLYAQQLKFQLSTCPTVLEWIRVWNASIGTYASHLFGPLANVFGKPHLDAVTRAHNLIFDIVLDKKSLADHIKLLLESHLGRPLPDPPFALEALAFLPTAYGGLGVKNPYTTLNIARNVAPEPAAGFKAFLEAEARYFDVAAERFHALGPAGRDAKRAAIFDDDAGRIAAVLGEGVDPDAFLARERCGEFRERADYYYLFGPPPVPQSPDLIGAYAALLEEPADYIDATEKVGDEVFRLAGVGGMKRWSQLSGEDRWVLQMYSEECIELYGGLEVWEREGVPMEALKMVRGSYGEDDEDEDEDDYSSVVSEV